MSITIKEIAEMAGVHRSTVDKVLHKRVGVSDGVRQKIQTIIDETGYEPNILGRALKRQEVTKIIAVILHEVDAYPYLKSGIEKAYEEYRSTNLKINYYVTKPQEGDRQAKIIETCIRQEVDSIVILPINTEDVKKAVNKAWESGIPVITINSDLEDSKRLCFIGENMGKVGGVAGRLMGEFLNNQGNIGIITNPNNFSVNRRYEGFTDLIENQYSGIKVVSVFETNEDPKDTFHGTMKMIENEPTINGLFITCGGVSGAVRAVKKLNKGKDIKIICFENYKEILQLMKEDFINCTITGDLEGQGYQAIKILFNLIVYEKKPESINIETTINILVKESIM